MVQVLMLLFFLALLPSLIMTSTGQSSFASGVFIFVCIHYIVILIHSSVSFAKFSIKKLDAQFLIVSILLFSVHSFFVMLGSYSFNLDKFLLSFFLMLLQFVSSLFFSYRLMGVERKSLATAVSLVLLMLVLNATLGLTGARLFTQVGVKPVGFFSEPSHLALVLTPFLMYAMVMRLKYWWLFLLFFFGWGILIQNLTTILSILLCLVVFFPKRYVSVVSVFLIAFLLEDDYFLSRFYIAADSDNLSVLVFLQGWQQAYLMLTSSSFIGGGFQQFGFMNLFGDLYDKIKEFGFDGGLNWFDGGTTAAKIVGEFGLFGVCIISLYVYYLFCAIRYLGFVKNKPPSECNFVFVFFACCIISYSVELFVRGVGYFSTGFYLLCASLPILRILRQEDSCEK